MTTWMPHRALTTPHQVPKCVSMARDGARRTASPTVSATRCPGCTDYRRRAARWGTQSHGGERAPCESDLSFTLSFSHLLFVLSLSLCRVTHKHMHTRRETRRARSSPALITPARARSGSSQARLPSRQRRFNDPCSWSLVGALSRSPRMGPLRVMRFSHARIRQRTIIHAQTPVKAVSCPYPGKHTGRVGVTAHSRVDHRLG